MSQERDANQDNAKATEASVELDQEQQEGEIELPGEGMTLAEAQILDLEQQLAKANATIDEQKDSVLRARAEMENARRRSEQEVDKARKYALEKFAGELLPVIDNLERAMQSANAEDDLIKPLFDGVDLTHKSFISIIEKFGMQVIDPQGESFNPDHHQAMSMQESVDVPPNTVLAVMQKGYVLNGRLLRPAMVMVSRAPSEGVDVKA
jgi:molecular chaperone GrpE